MAQQNRSTIKTYFETGDIPTEAQFGDSFDSQVFWVDDVETDLTSNSDSKVPTIKAVVDGINKTFIETLSKASFETKIAGNLLQVGKWYLVTGAYDATAIFGSIPFDILCFADSTSTILASNCFIANKSEPITCLWDPIGPLLKFSNTTELKITPTVADGWGSLSIISKFKNTCFFCWWRCFS
jgi:hypothetical protein